MSDEISNHTISKLANITGEQIKTPHAPLGSFVLPSGVFTDQGELLRDITVKEMSGNEEEIMASTKVSPTEKVNSLLSNCLIKIGPVEDRAEIRQLVKNMLASDRVFLLIAIRRVTLGDSYTFADKCPEEECEQESLYTVDLSTLEPVNEENAAKRSRETVLPSSGKTVRWHYLSGRDEERQVKHKEDKMSVGIWARVDAIDGTPPKIGDIKNLSQRDRQHLRDLFEEVEPGLDTSTDMECPVCGVEFTKQLDLSPSFFYPSRVKKTSKKRSSS